MSTRDEYLFSAACASPPQELTLDPKYQNIRFTTPIGRASYVTLVKPRSAQQGQDPKFSMTLLMAPDHCGDLWRAICMVANARWPSENRPNPQNPNELMNVNGEWMLTNLTRDQGGLHNPLRTGDSFYVKEPAKYEAYRGLYVLNAGVTAVSKKGESQQPVVLDEEGQELDPSKVYSGCYARAQITIFAFPQQGQSLPNRGIGVLLNAVQFAKSGERIGSFDPKRAAQAAFGQLPKETPSVPSGWGSTPPAGMSPGGFANPMAGNKLPF